VQLYGIIDVNIEAVSNQQGSNGDTTSTVGMRSGGRSPSRWGLRGSEDLGGGLKAVFGLESGISAANGTLSNPRFFSRRASVGLSGAWGTILMGRDRTPAFAMFSPYDPSLGGGQYAPLTNMLPSRTDNSVIYSVKGIKAAFSAYYSFNDLKGQSEDDLEALGAFGAAASYTVSKAFSVMVGYDQVKGETGFSGAQRAGNHGNAENAIVAAKGQFGEVHYKVAYRYRNTDLHAPALRPVESDLYMLGLEYHFAPKTMLGFTYYQERFNNAPQGWKGATGSVVHQFALLGTYALSKRTELYATASRTRNGPMNMGAAAGYTLARGKAGQTATALGVRHYF